MQTCRWVPLTFLAFAVSMSGCKSRPSESSDVKDDDSVGAGQSTAETLKYISDRVADGQWQWEIDVQKANRGIHGVKIAKSHEFFAAPYTAVQACPAANRTTIDGKPGCLAYDNAMRFNYTKGANAPVPYNHILKQQQGRSQPDLEKFLQAGDMIVYFHPEDRAGDLGEDGMQWRATHAATIVVKKGKVTTVDTPSGYAQPFTGVDDTAFHVFRFMPKDANGNDLPEAEAKKYRQMVAKWATLGYDQFEFSSDYQSVAGSLSVPDDLKKFANEYIKAATTGSSSIPDMYCAWFVYTNLNLGWMHPLNSRGLSGISVGNQVQSGGMFDRIQGGFEYGGDKSMNKYLDNADSLVAHDDFVFPAFTGYELINGFLARLVGPDDASLPAEAFVGFAKNKAGILQGLSQDPNILETLRSSRGRVPNFNARAVSDFNAKVPTMMLEMAKYYSDLADAVAAGQKTVAQATTTLREVYQMRHREKNQAFLDISKRWIPPYIYAYIADNYSMLPDATKKPPLAYIGTVVHEKYLKQRGSAGGGSSISPEPSIAAEPEDRELDKKMYQIVAQDPKTDMKGYLHFFECLASKDRQGCGSAIKRHLTAAEAQGLMSMANDWKVGRRLSEKDVLTRNKYGIDAVRFRRLLASYWNDPNKAFRPNFFSDVSSQIIKASLNFRILMNSPISMNAAQAPVESYARNERTETMTCIVATGEKVEGTPPTCAHAVIEFGTENYTLANDSADGSYGTWPATRLPAVGGGGGQPVARRQCARIYTADNSRGSRKIVTAPASFERMFSPFNDSISSMIVDKGCTLEVFGAYNFNVNQATGGRLNAGKETYTASGEEKRVSLVGTNLNDNISSLKCTCAAQ